MGTISDLFANVQSNNVFADVSSNNGAISVPTYRAAGHVILCVKATEGTNYVNPFYVAQVQECHKLGMTVVHYHFAHPDTNPNNPKSEAAYFLKEVLQHDGPHDYLMIDVERATPAGYKADPLWVQEFDSYIRSSSRYYTILYANKSTLEISDNWLTGSLKKRVADADWSNAPDYAPPGYTVAWRQRSGGTETLPGIGHCDVNVARGKFWEDVKKHHAK